VGQPILHVHRRAQSTRDSARPCDTERDVDRGAGCHFVRQHGSTTALPSPPQLQAMAGPRRGLQRRDNRNRFRTIGFAGWESESSCERRVAPSRNSATSLSSRSGIKTGAAFPRIANSSLGSPFGSVSAKSERAVAITVLPGTEAAVRTKSMTVFCTSGPKKSRLSMNRIAEPLRDKSVSSSRQVPSYPMESRNLPQPPGVVLFG